MIYWIAFVILSVGVTIFLVNNPLDKNEKNNTSKESDNNTLSEDILNEDIGIIDEDEDVE